MVKKIKSTAKSASSSSKAEALHGNPLASSVKDSAQQIWLAGMGAFSKAQEEGTKVFEALVKEGLNLQKKTQGIAEEKLGEVTGKLSAMADTVTAKTGQNWDKLEAIFEQRTAKAMGKLGVPTAKDVAELSARVDALAAQVAKLAKGGSKAETAKAAAPVKAAAKRATKAVKAAVAEVVEVAAEAAAPAPAVKKAPAKRARKTAAAA